MLYIAYIVLFLSFLNLLRMGVFLVGSDLFDIKNNLRAKRSSKTEPTATKRAYQPLVSVLVPAHNEALVLRRNLDSIAASTYKKIELIVINDSSTDRTFRIARSFQQKHSERFVRIKVINVKVRGKAKALNAGLVHAKGSLFMCLDADSAITSHSIAIAVSEFADPRIASISSNVKIFASGGLLSLFQQVEYLVCYQMKKTETAANIQYIVGGIGSMFRTRLIRNIGNYDTSTITEDIDLSMKILARYGSKYRISYNPQVIAYTEPVHDMKGLMRQRFRWKYGRYQAFLKHKELFGRQNQSSKLLGVVYLPYALVSEMLYVLEPLTVLLVIYLLVQFGSVGIIAASFLTFTFYTTMHITAATTSYSLSERLRFIAIAPITFVGMFVLSLVEYTATIYGFIKLRTIYQNHKTGHGVGHWTHVERKGNATIS